jgi:hypothetical protein
VDSAAENRHEILNFLLSLVLEKTDDSGLQVISLFLPHKFQMSVAE